jgi:hypothetical protein
MATYKIPVSCYSHMRATRKNQRSKIKDAALHVIMWWQKTSNVVPMWENYKAGNLLTEKRKGLIAVSTSLNLYFAPFFWRSCHKSFKLMFINYHISNCFIFKYISMNYYYFPARILPTFINLQYHPNYTTNTYFMLQLHLNSSFYCWWGAIKTAE